jgi:hypothetical protein
MLPALLFASLVFADPVPVTKTNPMPVYMHYMPWFETPATLGGSNWGFHWKFNNQNPNIVDPSGKRQIASHYYPKIGPYASSDPDVIEYHLHLMKLSGVDGVLIDWYGIQGTNGDIVSLRQNSEHVIRSVDEYGLKFGVVLEDRFSANINQAVANVDYLRHNPNPGLYPNYPGYFENPDYIRMGAGNDPLLPTFGPITFQQPSQWTTILGAAGEDVEFLPLWYESADAGTNANGEYSWIYEDESADNHWTHQSNFYRFRADAIGTAGGSAYPGFVDFYQEGGLGQVVPFEIPHDDGQTLEDLLELAEQYANKIQFLQLNTFNDFGEGTMFEPTVETGFEYLKQIQQYTGVSYGESELQLVYRLYLARKKYAGNASIDAELDQVSALLAALDIAAATSLLDSAAPAGDYDADGDVDTADFTVWRSKFGTSTILYGSGADGNYDGAVDAGDYLIWRQNQGAGGGGATGVPEPTAVVLLGFSAVALCSTGSRRYLRRTVC